MRIKNIIRNVFASFLSCLMLFILGIVTRKLFLKHFTVQYLGYEGLFSSIFTILSVAEMGAGSMFHYMLYEALAKQDDREVSVIMGMYQKLYRVIGMAVLFSGTVIFFFLPRVIREEGIDWTYVRLIYIIQLAGTLTTYFLAYRRSVLIADQKGYRVTEIETFYALLAYLVRIGIILLTGSYIFYLLVPFAASLMSNFRISKYASKTYPQAFKHKSRWDDFKERNAFYQLKNMMINKVSTLIYSASDNIIISAVAGITTVGLYSNYQQINGAVIRVTAFVTGALEQSTGNLVYSESSRKIRKLFDIMDFLFFVYSCIVFCSMVTCFQRLITLLYGKDYLIPFAAVLMLAFDFYIRCRGTAYTSFASAIGHYETNRGFAVASAAVNVILSVVLGVWFGLAGILMATVFGNILIQSGRLKIVFQWLFKEKPVKAIFKELEFIGVSSICCMACFFLTKNIRFTFGGLTVSLLLTVLLSLLIIWAVYYRTPNFKECIAYLKEVCHSLIQ